MAGSEGRPSITALQETLQALRSEINDLKNRPGDADILANLRTELDAVKDQIAAARAAPKSAPESDNGQKTKTTHETGDTPRVRFGFW